MVRTQGLVVAQAQLSVAVGPLAQAELGLALFGMGGATEDVDDPMQGIAAVEGGAGAAQYLHPLGLLGIGLEQLVDIAKPRRSEGDAVFGHGKRTTGTGNGQSTGTHRRQELLATAAAD